MAPKRKVEVFTAGCPVCQGVVEMINELACPHCEVAIYNLTKNEGVDEAKAYGVTALPSVVVNGELLECCKRSSITKEDLKAAGIGQPLCITKCEEHLVAALYPNAVMVITRPCI